MTAHRSRGSEGAAPSADTSPRRSRDRRALLRGDRERARISLSITPMIDVVFQLLIYFLLTAGLVAKERNLRAEMPPETAEAAAEPDPFALDTEPLVIRVDPSPDAARARISLPSGLATPRDVAELERILRDARFDEARAGGLFPADHPIRIAAAPEARWEDVVGVFNAVIAAGYRSVAFGGGS
ncbi:MAG: biopolymer transporter ExbD [Planctomycetaceae bacterium]|nr:biopolymer transporter ExbD [Planctomycetaceae bacterium]